MHVVRHVARRVTVDKGMQCAPQRVLLTGFVLQECRIALPGSVPLVLKKKATCRMGIGGGRCEVSSWVSGQKPARSQPAATDEALMRWQEWKVLQVSSPNSLHGFACLQLEPTGTMQG